MCRTDELVNSLYCRTEPQKEMWSGNRDLGPQYRAVPGKGIGSPAQPNTEDEDRIFEKYLPKHFSVLANFVALRSPSH